MTKASDNPFPYMRYVEGTTPSSPASGSQRLFVRSSDHVLCMVNSSGTVTALSGSLTNPMTTAQDIIVGGTAGAPGRLAIGAAGGSLGSLNSVVAYNSGTSMPGSKATGDRYWRTDLGLEFYWDGTRWLCTCEHIFQLGLSDAILPITSTQGGLYRSTVPYTGVYAIFIETTNVMFEVGGGTALDASNKWVGTIADDGGTFATITINSGSSSTFRNDTQTISSARVSTSKRLISGWTKTGTPGFLYVAPTITFRIIGT